MKSNEKLLVCFGINGKRRLIPILWYKGIRIRSFIAKSYGEVGNYPPSVDVLQKNTFSRRGLRYNTMYLFIYLLHFITGIHGYIDN